MNRMQLQLSKLEKSNNEVQRIRAVKQLQEGWKNIDEMLNYQSFFFVPEIIRLELIDWYPNNPLAEHYEINKTYELVARKYYWSTFCHNIEIYVKNCNVCLALTAVCYKFYKNLQSFLVLTYHWKNLLIDFLTGLPVSTNWKDETYDMILVIVNWLIKMIYYKLVKITINAFDPAKVIINAIMSHYSLLYSMVSDSKSVFNLKFWLLFCYFLNINRRFSTSFYSRTNSQTKRQNSTMEAYFRAFVNFEQDN